MSNNYKKKATSFKPNKKLYRVMLQKQATVTRYWYTTKPHIYKMGKYKFPIQENFTNYLSLFTGIIRSQIPLFNN